jgi:DNA-binding beta-propeller fold protein YncE
MSNKTITKFSVFVIFLAGLCFGAAGCSHFGTGGETRANVDADRSPFGKPAIIGKIASSDITESSGIAVSKCQPDVFWTHNDSGDGPFIFAINSKGDSLGTWKVQGAENTDWEDIAEFKDASGHCYLYIGEIGDNGRKRSEQAVYRVKEPVTSADTAKSDAKSPLETETADAVKFTYPDGNLNAETLMVHPATGDIYVLTKRRDGPSGVYKIKPQFGSTVSAEKIAEIKVPSIPNGLLTGGDIAPDGKHVAVCDYQAGYELVLPAGDANFDDIWKQEPKTIDLGQRKQGEAIGYGTDSNSLFATSEGKHQPLIEVQRQK